MRDIGTEMGRLQANSRFVHLYLNGLYWGVYNLIERLDDAFFASHLGGQQEDFDIVKGRQPLGGNLDKWNELNDLISTADSSNDWFFGLIGRHSDGTRDEDLELLLDVDNLIDYMLLHIFGGPDDWPQDNWYAVRQRGAGSDGFQFLVWDQEDVLDGRHLPIQNGSNTPANIFFSLRRNAVFRQRFADRAFRVLSDGPLSIKSSQDAWLRRANEIEGAIVAESARWGDHQESDTFPLRTIEDWRQERDRVVNEIIPQAWSLTVSRLLEQDLLSDIAPPTATERQTELGTEIALFSDQGQIYYTTDGSDPRQIGGEVSQNARRYSQPVRLDSLNIVARVLDDGKWSAPLRLNVEAVAASSLNLRVTELHYHPAESPAIEFIEIMNVGTRPVKLDGVKFTDGVRFEFDSSGVDVLFPEQRIVIVRDEQAFRDAYGNEILIAGTFLATALSNGGESVALVGGSGNVIQRFTYDDSADWPQQADGRGPSLQVIDVFGDYDSPRNWRASAVHGGTPGSAKFLPGDTNLDRRFNATDLIMAFQAGEYEDAIDGNSDWSEGDWNGDGDFGTADLVLAFQTNVFEKGMPTPALPSAASGTIARQVVFAECELWLPFEEEYSQFAKNLRRRVNTTSSALSLVASRPYNVSCPRLARLVGKLQATVRACPDGSHDCPLHRRPPPLFPLPFAASRRREIVWARSLVAVRRGIRQGEPNGDREFTFLRST